MAFQSFAQPRSRQDAVELTEPFLRIMEEQSIYSVYQPIVSLQDGTVFGYEALTRGPAGSGLEAPQLLFQYAQEQGRLYALERLSREKAIAGARLAQRQPLFINVSAQVLSDPQFVPGQTLELLQASGMTPAQVVFEITERSSIEDFTRAQKVLEHYRRQGYRIAIDDAGAGYSSLQAIAELQPDFIKIDRSLIQGLHQIKVKEYIVETFVTFAHKMNIQLIAEGIEEPDELVKLTHMGVHHAQGYLLGRPGPGPADVPPLCRTLIAQHQRLLMTGGGWMIGDLAAPAQVFEGSDRISAAADYFKRYPEATGAVVVRQGTPVGLLMRERLFQQLAGQYGFSLFWNRSIEQAMDPAPLIVDERLPVERVSQMATSRSIRNLYDLVIITSGGKMAGVASVRAMLESITNARMESARVASPLTGLPGNLQINRELSKRLVESQPFCVIYGDLDFFKWFNDKFGFQKGDSLIQYTADCLQTAMAACGTPHDFIGHVGGDDFIVISLSEEPERLCREMLRRFEAGVMTLYEPDQWMDVEDRMGNRADSDGVSLSLSLLIILQETAVTPELISQAAARLKKQAKAHKGSVVCSRTIGALEEAARPE
ncbi:EAL and GGDEF domain-containing protein [Paenibacillus athensensis]|nr:bifunctional diguanylate cyclase/phosphodiesterase [Paenibacillus athensensis]MCD1258948.1 EAL and GGDEF domain-containing protein [Paenibacillus athensensis]